MAFRFGDSFSHYATADLLKKWTALVQPGSGAECSILPTGGRTGAGALEVTTGFLAQVYAQKTLGNQATWTIGVAVNYTVGSNVGLMFLMDGSTRQIGIAINTNGTLYLDKNGTTVATSSSVITSGWNYIELQATFNGGSGSATINVNDSTFLTYSGNVSPSGNNQANSVCLGDWIGPHTTQNVLYCDFYANDGTGSTNNTFWGDIRVVATVPTSDGNYTSFSVTGAGSAHAAVNEEPPDGDTSYVSDNTPGDRETFVFPGPSGSMKTALAIQTVLDAKKDSTGARSIAASLRISSTDYDGATVFPNTQYVFYVEQRPINPNTGVAWTTVEFTSGVEAGLTIVS